MINLWCCSRLTAIRKWNASGQETIKYSYACVSGADTIVEPKLKLSTLPSFIYVLRVASSSGI